MVSLRSSSASTAVGRAEPDGLGCAEVLSGFVVTGSMGRAGRARSYVLTKKI